MILNSMQKKAKKEEDQFDEKLRPLFYLVYIRIVIQRINALTVLAEFKVKVIAC